MILKRWRLVLWWLLTLALPVQGHAAATMRWCHGGAHQVVGAAAAREEPAAHVHHADGHVVGHGHQHAPGGALHGGATGDPAWGMSPPADEGDAAASSDAGGGCSACAACCVIAMPATPLAGVAGPGARYAYVDCTAGPRPGFLTAAPERPPRPVRA